MIPWFRSICSCGLHRQSSQHWLVWSTCGVGLTGLRLKSTSLPRSTHPTWHLLVWWVSTCSSDWEANCSERERSNEWIPCFFPPRQKRVHAERTIDVYRRGYKDYLSSCQDIHFIFLFLLSGPKYSFLLWLLCFKSRSVWLTFNVGSAPKIHFYDIQLIKEKMWIWLVEFSTGDMLFQSRWIWDNSNCDAQLIRQKSK